MGSKSKFDDCTNDEIINMIQNVSAQLNKAISERLLGKYNLPSKRYILKRLDCHSWNDVLRLCNLPINKVTKNEYTVDMLINILQNISIKLGKSPTIDDINRDKSVPSPDYFYDKFNTLSWNEILRTSGLQYNHFIGYTDDECISNLIEFSKYLNKIPTREDFKIHNWKPKHTIYCERFGTYENACFIAGLIGTPLTKQEKIDIAINELIRLANELKKCPSVEEYESLRHNGYSRRILEINLKLKYNDICKKYIPQYDLNNNRDRTINDIAQDIQKVYNILGRTPLHDELKKYGVTISYNLINRLFNGLSYNQILVQLGFVPTGTTTLTKSKDDLLYDFKMLMNKLNRVPTCEDINNSDLTASYPTYSKYFGTIHNICTILNIDYQVYNGIAYVLRDKLGNLSLSSKENDISNFLIDNNISFIKEYSYGNFILGDRRRFDWKINMGDKEYYVEYFGMYTGKQSASKIINEYNQKVQAKLKAIYKCGLIDDCIFIYPNDLKHKSLNEIFFKLLHI
jgi:hypothetical protein